MIYYFKKSGLIVYMFLMRIISKYFHNLSRILTEFMFIYFTGFCHTVWFWVPFCENNFLVLQIIKLDHIQVKHVSFPAPNPFIASKIHVCIWQRFVQTLLNNKGQQILCGLKTKSLTKTINSYLSKAQQSKATHYLTLSNAWFWWVLFI